MFNRSTSYIIMFLSFSSVLDVLSFGSGSGNGIGMGISMVNALPARVRREIPQNKARALKFRREDSVVKNTEETLLTAMPVLTPITPNTTGENKARALKRQEDGNIENTEEPDWDSDEGKSLGRLLRDYQLLKNAIPAAPEGSGLKDGLMREVENMKQLISAKFGQPLPDEPTPSGEQPVEGNSATTVSSADGSLVTVYTLADGNLVIASNGQNKTVTLGDNAMWPNTNTPAPTPTETVPRLSTSLGWVTLTSASTSASAATSALATASATGKNPNGATLAGPFSLLPGTMVMKGVLTTIVGLLLGAWVAL